MVYETYKMQLNSTVDGWDGTFGGKPMNLAVFVFMAELEYNDGTKEIISGDITLVKN